MSLWQMPQASTLIRTWLRAGPGMFLSTSSKLPPGLPTWTAFIFDMGTSSLIRVDGNMERKNNEMCEGTVRTQGSVEGWASLCRNQGAVPPGLDFVPLSFPALTCRAFLGRRFAAGVVACSTFLLSSGFATQTGISPVLPGGDARLSTRRFSSTLPRRSARGCGRARGNRCRHRPAWGRGDGGQADLSWRCCRLGSVRPALGNPSPGRHHCEDDR